MSKANDILNGLGEKSPGMEIRSAMEKVMDAAQSAIGLARLHKDKEAEQLLIKLKKSAKDTLTKWSVG